MRTLVGVMALIALALALTGCAGLPTFAAPNHGYDPLLADAVRATMENPK